jgi:purine-binding chemotaxis protein CheW
MKPQKLDDQQQAVFSYLESLLNEVPEHVETEAAAEAPASVTTTATVTPLPISEVAEPASVATVAPTPTESPRLSPTWAEDEQELHILLFQVAGLTLAVPMQHLNGILEIPADGITPMPGHAPWFLGLLHERDSNIKVVDTAQLVVPEKFRQNHTRDQLQKIILIDDNQWGLACDAVDEVIKVQRDQVHWRGEHGKRPWLAGTLKQQMCALLDVDEFAAMLGSDAAGPAP